MKRIDAGVAKQVYGCGIGHAIAIVGGSMVAVALFLWWIGGMEFWHAR